MTVTVTVTKLNNKEFKFISELFTYGEEFCECFKDEKEMVISLQKRGFLEIDEESFADDGSFVTKLCHDVFIGFQFLHNKLGVKKGGK